MQTRFERLQAWVGAALCWVCSLVFGFSYYTLYHIFFVFLQGETNLDQFFLEIFVFCTKPVLLLYWGTNRQKVWFMCQRVCTCVETACEHFCKVFKVSLFQVFFISIAMLCVLHNLSSVGIVPGYKGQVVPTWLHSISDHQEHRQHHQDNCDHQGHRSDTVMTVMA